MRARAEGADRTGLTRLRWRLRGALLWPSFVVLTLLEMLFVHWLPLAGDDTSLLGGLLLAGSLNVMAVALVGGLGGVVLRRRRRDLPKVVAEDYAGTAALALVAIAFLVAGLVHRPERASDRASFAQQSLAVQRWVQANGDAYTRAHVSGATTLRIDTDLYRSCLPGPDPKRWLCLFVDTSSSPPRVRRDPNRESNASFNPRGGFR